MSPFTGVAKFRETESKVMAARGWRRSKEQKFLLNKRSFSSVLRDKKVPEIHGGDQYTVMRMYLKSPNCTLKNGYDGKSYVVFYVMHSLPQFEKMATF